jgi:hypothetical protein
VPLLACLGWSWPGVAMSARGDCYVLAGWAGWCRGCQGRLLLVWSAWVEWAVVSGDRSAPRVSWDELLVMTPQVIRETLPMVPWDAGKLWALELPVARLRCRSWPGCLTFRCGS